MTLSAEFSVEGDSSVTAHEVAYGATVDLALLSDSGVNVVAWSIQGTSHESFTAPTITPAGSPSGKTASFAMPADPGGGEGRSVLVKCTVTDSALNQAVAYRVVGVANDLGVVPIAAGEENHRSATHGWIEPVNTALATVGGGGGPATLPIDAAHGDVILRGEIDAGGTDAPLVTWGTNTDELLIGDATNVAGIATHVGPSGYLEWWINGVEEYSASSTEFNFRNNNVLTEGYLQIGATTAQSGSIRLTSTGSVSARNNAGSADVDLLQKTSADLVIIGDSTDASGVEFKTKTATGFTFDVAGTDIATLDATALALGARNLTTTGNIQIGATPSATGDVRLGSGSGWSIKARNFGNSADTRVIDSLSSGALNIGEIGSYNTIDIQATTSVGFYVAGAVDAFRVSRLSATNINWSANGASGNYSALTIGLTTEATATNTTRTITALVGRPKSGNTSTVGDTCEVVGGAVTGAGGTHVGGIGSTRGGSATGGSGTRTGGDAWIGGGTGASRDGNVYIGKTSPASFNWQSMGGGIAIEDRSAAPTGDPAGATFLYSESGVLNNRSTGVTLRSGGTERFSVNATGIGFYATAPIAKPTVSGAKGSNAALGSLMTALSNLGLVTDSTSA